MEDTAKNEDVYLRPSSSEYTKNMGFDEPTKGMNIKQANT